MVEGHHTINILRYMDRERASSLSLLLEDDEQDIPDL